jgi:hypothetical protein
MLPENRVSIIQRLFSRPSRVDLGLGSLHPCEHGGHVELLHALGSGHPFRARPERILWSVRLNLLGEIAVNARVA